MKPLAFQLRVVMVEGMFEVYGGTLQLVHAVRHVRQVFAVQATMVMHINNYLGLKPDQFQAGFLQPGILLCVLCIVLWALCIYKDL